MAKNHSYHSLKVPDDAPFELKPSPGKGWGAFATRRINRGAMILREKPLFIIRKPHQEIMEADIYMAFQQLTRGEKDQIRCLRDNGSTPFTHLTQVLAENSFAIELQANSPPVHGLFLLQSRFNHSCIPNAKIPTVNNEESIASFATRDIMVGEEITFCYNTDFEGRSRQDRHQNLRFMCDCKACSSGSPFQQLSDIRRTMIRGLEYLTNGVDLDGQRQGSASSIILKPKLKELAENFSIPITDRLIYKLLTIFLLEEEGLLDDFMVERVLPGVLRMVTLLQTESNADIAKLAMTQKTWLGRVCVAFRLYGRKDIADHAVSEVMQMVKGLPINRLS